MKKHLFITGLIIVSVHILWSQTQPKKIPDDESIVILKEIKEKLSVLKTAEIKFSLYTEKEGKTFNITKGHL